MWTPVVNPRPVFNGADEKARYERAVATTRRIPGEDVNVWLERVTAAVRADESSPRAAGLFDRQPGEDG